MKQIHVQLLGGFSVAIDSVTLPGGGWRSRRASSLVKLLALTPGRRLHREQVIEILWPDAGLSSAANSLHQTLHMARQVMHAGGAHCLALKDGFLSLVVEPAYLVVDIELFQQAAQQAQDNQTLEAYQGALQLYTGPLLPDDLYEEWTFAPRDALHRTFVELLFGLAGLLEARQEYAQAIQTLQRLLAADPANETAHTRLMRLYALNGQRQSALQQYQTLREAMQTHFAAEPSPEAAQFYGEILSGRLLPPVSKVVSPGEVHPRRLPAPLTSFIGREKEIRAVLGLLEAARLVTLTGAGGVGKTRLALRAAEGLQDEFRHGVWWVDLAPLSDENRVMEAVAGVFQLKAYGETPLAEVLDNYLREKQLLLVLDNCEHLLEACAQLIHHLLQTAPQLRVLVTSRAALGINGETIFYVPSLTFPAGTGSLALEDSLAFEAVRLFVERARAVYAAFQLTPENAPAVTRICRRLDGIPLAIELAAARTRLLTVAQIAARLDKAFDLLTGGSRAVLPRHQTLRALIDWSYDLLIPPERALLSRLSVFAGGWTLEAAERVCADDEENEPDRIQTHQVVDLLGGLVDQSLVQFEPAPGAEPRYRMLETVRQYARGRLIERGEESVLRERHLDYYLSLGQQAEPHLRAKQARSWLDRLERELDNLRMALEFSLIGLVIKGLQLATFLWWFWHIRNHSLEGTEWLEKLLQKQKIKSEDQTFNMDDKVARGRALNVLCNIYEQHYAVGTDRLSLIQLTEGLAQESQVIFQKLGKSFQRDYAISRFNQAKTLEDFLECRSLFQTLDDPFWISECDLELYKVYPPNDDRALFYCKEYLALRKEIGDLDGAGWATSGLGSLELCRGNVDRFIELLLEGISLLEAVGNRLYAAVVHSRLALFYTSQGNYPEALRQSEFILATAQDTNNQALFYEYFTRQAYVAWAKYDYNQADFCCKKALMVAKDFLVEKKFFSFYLLSRIALSQGKINSAKAFLKNIFQPDASLELREISFGSIQAMGIIAVLEGQMKQAAVWFGVQDGVCGIFNWPVNSLTPPENEESDQALAAARAALGEAAFSAAWNEGRALTIEQVVIMAQKALA